VLDCASYSQRDPREDLRTVVAELTAYAEQVPDAPYLLDRPALVFLNKVDADPETAEIITPDLEADGWEVLSGSAVTGAGLQALRRRMAALVVLARSQREAEAAPSQRPVLRPAEHAGDDVHVERVDEGWRIRSERVERWVVMTDLDNPEAVRHLQGRMVRAGVEEALRRAGARPGDAVDIAGAVFDFSPDVVDEPDNKARDQP
ncbi:MAG: Obg family GTPase CgtA, partial [Egibacteraceae bacterium]